MGLLSSITKPFKKVLKSDLGKAAVGIGSFLYGPKLFGVDTKGGAGGWGKALSVFKNMPAWKQAVIVGGTTAAGSQVVPEEVPEVPDVDDATAHADYLRGRKGYLAEWAEWKAEQEGISYAEALADLEANPMFQGSKGGRVKAQGGLFAGQMAGRHPGMNPMGMNQGLGAPNLGSRSMGMTPGMGGGGGQMDPRMAQMMQGQGRGRPRTTGIPKQSEDTELIQLIKMLTSLGIPMEQLRGRTKEELVEMIVSVSGKGGQEKVVEEDVIEEQDIREQQAAGGGLMRTGYAMGTEHPIIPSKDGNQLDMRDEGGYQPHGKAEKHDDVRALLAQGEFVMTSDAVKGMGGGDREQGAQKMYNLMHNMEAMA
jgi:hypothetical protein